jgi:hypothetical protein
MRQLGTTQSITFFAPPGVYQNILDLRKKTPESFIDSFDVVCWLFEESCSGIEQLQPMYFSQGTDYCLRAQYVQFVSSLCKFMTADAFEIHPIVFRLLN